MSETKLLSVETLLSKLESLPPGYQVSIDEGITYHRRDGTVASEEDILADEEKFLRLYLEHDFLKEYGIEVTLLPNISDFIRRNKRIIRELAKGIRRVKCYEVIYGELVYNFVKFLLGGERRPQLTEDEKKRLSPLLTQIIVDFDDLRETYSSWDDEEDEAEEIISRYRMNMDVEDLDSTAVEKVDEVISKLVEALGSAGL